MTIKEKPLHRLRGVFGALQAIEATMPIQIASTFLTVALFPDRSMGEYSELAGVAPSTMSRHLLDLGERNRNKEPGYQLVERRNDPQDLRKNTYRLSPKGQRLVHTITALMED